MPEQETERRQRAVALEYAAGDRAPRVIAAGAGEVARRIIKLAEDHNIPVRKDDSLVEVLSKLNVGLEIPVETYRAVAELLAFLYRTDDAWRKRVEAGSGKKFVTHTETDAAEPADELLMVPETLLIDDSE
jgi:flagellar biosynthesis protein